MKIIIFQGSPNARGSTYLLANAFLQGAVEAGHEVEMVGLARMNIHPCFGCVKCGYEGPCVQKDGMEELRKKILSSDMLVFATPLYYYGFSAQMKILIDRFCAINGSLMRKKMKSALLAVAWNGDDWTFEALKIHYRTLVRYLHFSDAGMVLGAGCGYPSLTKDSRYIGEAYSLGRNL